MGALCPLPVVQLGTGFLEVSVAAGRERVQKGGQSSPDLPGSARTVVQPSRVSLLCKNSLSALQLSFLVVNLSNPAATPEVEQGAGSVPRML